MEYLNDYCAITEHRPGQFHKTRLSIWSFIDRNGWFNGRIIILVLSESDLKKEERSQLEQIHQRIEIIEMDSNTAGIIKKKTHKKFSANYRTLDFSFLYAFKIKSKGNLYFSSSVIFNLEVTSFLNDISATFCRKFGKLPTGSGSEVNPAMFYIPGHLISVELFDTALSLFQNNNSIFDPNSKSQIITESINSLQIPMNVLSLINLVDASQFPENKYREFLRYNKSIRAMNMDSIDHRDNKFVRINLFWQQLNKKSLHSRPSRAIITKKRTALGIKGKTRKASQINNTIHGDGPKMLVTFNMATMPQRVNTAIKAIESVYNQADAIRLYLNNFTSVPEEFKRDKIKIYQGEDLRSTGKLFWANNKNEYYFCIDDDLYYPPTYARDMIAKLNEHNDNAIISLHGKQLKSGKKTSYFKDATLSLHCLHEVASDTPVHVIGNGVSVFNTNKFYPDYKKFKYHYMDDIMVSIQAQEQNIKAVVMAHSKDYMKYLTPQGSTLHDEFSRNDTTQTEMINTIKWNFIDNNDDYSIVIPSYNRYEMLANLINQFNKYANSRKINIIVIDDNSTDIKYENIKNLDNVIYHKNSINNGKRRFYKTINTAFDYLKTLKSKHVMFLADDMVISENFFNHIDTLCSKYPNTVVNYTTYKDRKYSNWGFNDWIDGAFYTTYQNLSKVGEYINDVGNERFIKNPNISSGVWHQYTNRLQSHGIKLFHTKYSLAKHLGHTDSVMHDPNFRRNEQSKLLTSNFIDDHINADVTEELK